MIPKIIHYCWFGGNPLPDSAKKYIESWKTILSDYEIKEWNESNFDIRSNTYVYQAYQSGKFAFVSDYVRLYALLTEGGIYMDTDVEVIRSFNEFLNHKAFLGFETESYISTGILASEKNSEWVRDLLHEYGTRNFILENGDFDMSTNAEHITNYMHQRGILLNNTYQNITGLVAIYPTDYFCPKDQGSGEIKLTKNSVCIHHYACTWLPKHLKIRHFIKLKLAKIFGQQLIDNIKHYCNI